MNLLPKEPVDRPCEAETFDEAYRKNKVRLDSERRGAKDLYDGMKANGEPGAEAVDPAFWAGALAANDQAYAIYQEEVKEALRRAADRVRTLPVPALLGKVHESGWADIHRNWATALAENDPVTIVYW
jgi:hypothetical protein